MKLSLLAMLLLASLAGCGRSDKDKETIVIRDGPGASNIWILKKRTNDIGPLPMRVRQSLSNHASQFDKVALMPLPQTTPLTNTCTITLAWDAVADPALAGYRLYYGTNNPGASTNFVWASTNDVGNVTQTTISNLTRYATYYFGVTDYTTNGLESVIAQTVVATMPATPPGTNVATLWPRLWQRTGLDQQWSEYIVMPGWNFTNMPGAAGAQYFRMDMMITQTNVTRQVLRLTNNVLAITNK